MARVLQGVGGAMMVPVGRLTVMKIVPRAQYMAAMTFVTLPGQVGPLLGPALGGILVEYASWHWIFLINLPVGIIGAIATLTLMPNYKMQTRRFDFFGFILLAAGMAMLPFWPSTGKRAGDILPVAPFCWWRWGSPRFSGICGMPEATTLLFSLNLFRNPTYRLGLFGSLPDASAAACCRLRRRIFTRLGWGFLAFPPG